MLMEEILEDENEILALENVEVPSEIPTDDIVAEAEEKLDEIKLDEITPNEDAGETVNDLKGNFMGSLAEKKPEIKQKVQGGIKKVKTKVVKKGMEYSSKKFNF